MMVRDGLSMGFSFRFDDWSSGTVGGHATPVVSRAADLASAARVIFYGSRSAVRQMRFVTFCVTLLACGRRGR